MKFYSLSKNTLQSFFICKDAKKLLTLSISTDNSANHCRPSLSCITHAICKQAEIKKWKLDQNQKSKDA